MLHHKLKLACSDIAQWCASRSIACGIVCDEHNVQGRMLYVRRPPRDLPELLRHLTEAYSLCVLPKHIRGGVVLLCSLAALAEETIQGILEETTHMTFAERIAVAFQNRPAVVRTDVNIQRTSLAVDTRPRPAKFHVALEGALDGMATPTNQQPQDLFTKFADALRNLGDTIGIGPLQQHLRKQGIKWKKSHDGMNIIMYVMNATTNAPQPIARISAQTLENSHDFEEQLTAMLDFAKGQAPGTQKQKQQEMQDAEKAVRDIAKSYQPPAAGTAGAAPAVGQAAPVAPVQTAPAPVATAPTAPVQPTTSSAVRHGTRPGVRPGVRPSMPAN